MSKGSSVIILFLLTLFIRAQTITPEPKQIETLKLQMRSANTDSALCQAYILLSQEYYESNPDSGVHYASLSFELANKINNPGFQIDALNTLSIINRERGEYNSALSKLHTALNIAQKNNVENHYFKMIYSALNLAYTEQGNYNAGIEYGFKTLHENEKDHDTLSMALANNNIANTYFQIKQNEKALKHYKIAFDYATKINHLYGQSLVTGNIGSVFFEMHKYDSAKIFFDKSLILTKQIDDVLGEAIANGNIGSYYASINDDNTAIEFFKKAEKIYINLKMQPNLADVYCNLSISYLNINDNALALKYAYKSLEIANLVGSFPQKEDAHLALKNVYETINDLSKAYYHYREYIAARDSTFNEENKNSQFKSEILYEYNKKRYSDSLDQVLSSKIQQDELSMEREKTETQRKLAYSAITGFLLMLLLSLIIYKGYKDKQKANKIISEQKKQVEIQKQKIELQKSYLETKNKEVTDSITYAKRLQDAILPPKIFFNKYLNESFILYKPKDIVAGDFYWISPEISGDSILLAAADCTGHGVPGAMVSVVCSNALNRTVKEFGLREPGKILDKVRELVVDTFIMNAEESKSEVKDGMDISLCSISKNNTELLWAGANNPLWIIKNKELIEFKPDKQPIGKVDNPRPFTTKKISLEKGNTIYLFTDGYADQFGGSKGKKMKYKKVQELLISNNDLSMEEQKIRLDNALEEWKGNLEQVDDILIIGIRI